MRNHAEQTGKGFSLGALVLVITSVAVCSAVYAPLVQEKVQPKLADAIRCLFPVLCCIILAAVWARYIFGWRWSILMGLLTGLAAASVYAALLIMPDRAVRGLVMTTLAGSAIVLVTGWLVGFLGGLQREPPQADEEPEATGV